MEPESTSKLKASFGEYEELGKEHKRVSDRIAALQEAMKFSRQSGAFQALQNQMREVKELVKQKENLDGKMAVADLARKKDDDHRLAVKQEVSYSEQLGSVSERIEQLASMVMQYSEQNTDSLDFARCQRPDGSFYGTRGKCKKGKEAGAAAAPQSQSRVKAAPRKESLEDTKKTMAANRAAYLDEKKQSLKRGPLHKEVSQAGERVKERVPELKSRQQELERLERAARKHAAVTKKDPSKENRERMKLIMQALRDQERAVNRTQREIDKLRRQWISLHKKNERAKMSPEQRKAEAALDKQIRLMG